MNCLFWGWLMMISVMWHLPSSRLTRTSCPARVLLLVRHTIVPMIHVMPCPVSAKRATMERQPPHGDDVEAHTPMRLDRQMSMARREFMAIPLNEGFSCMQSSSGILLGSLLSLLPLSAASSLCWLVWFLFWPGLLALPRLTEGPPPPPLLPMPPPLLLLLPLLLPLPLPRGGWWFKDMNSGLLRTLFLSRVLDLTL